MIPIHTQFPQIDTFSYVTLNCGKILLKNGTEKKVEAFFCHMCHLETILWNLFKKQNFFLLLSRRSSSSRLFLLMFHTKSTFLIVCWLWVLRERKMSKFTFLFACKQMEIAFCLCFSFDVTSLSIHFLRKLKFYWICFLCWFVVDLNLNF